MVDLNIDPRIALREELNRITLDDGIIKVMSEISYTASEGGVVDMQWRQDEEGLMLLKLVLLAITYKDKCFNHLRM